jgi:hypothetical protein
MGILEKKASFTYISGKIEYIYSIKEECQVSALIVGLVASVLSVCLLFSNRQKRVNKVQSTQSLHAQNMNKQSEQDDSLMYYI